MHIHDEDRYITTTKQPCLAVVDIWGGMKKWGADFGIPEVVVRDYPKQSTIVDFYLVLATRLSKRYKYA